VCLLLFSPPLYVIITDCRDYTPPKISQIRVLNGKFSAMIRFRCKNCGQKLKVEDTSSGKPVKCPKCGSVGVVPASSDKIKFHCKECGRKISVPQIHAGKKGKCPKCRNIVVVPKLGDLSAVDSQTASVEQPSPAPTSMVGFQCPMCDENMQVPESFRGKIIECPSCGSYAEVPTSEEYATESAEQTAAAGKAAVDESGRPVAGGLGSVICPSCDKQQADDAKVCINCGIYVRTGRPILTARGADEYMLYDRSRRVVSPISWLVPLGVYPVFSEVMGKHKPYATWAIAVVTIVVSIWFLGYKWSGSGRMGSLKNLMLWSGNVEPDGKRIRALYEYTNYGDRQVFEAKKEALKDTVPAEELDRAALKELTPKERCFGQYAHAQLISHAFLHGSLLHLAGNMLFLLIFSSRVNSVIGNILTLILYPLLAVAAALTQMQMAVPHPPTAMLGASGAVMGMAGVYLLLFPIHRIYMTAWARWGLIGGFHLSFKVFAVRGFWVVLFYIFFDVVAVSLAAKTSTAHWAHIGGLLWGIAGGFALLVSRVAYSRSDVLSLILGKYAWPLVGSPHSHKQHTA